MDFQWYAMDERGVVAKVESIASPLASGAIDPFKVARLEDALHCRPDLENRLYRYREQTSCEHRVHVRYQQPEAPLTLEELVAACPIAAGTVQVVAIDFDSHDAFLPEEVVDETCMDGRGSMIVEKEPTTVASTG